MKRTKPVSLTFTTEEHRALKSYADKEGAPVAQVVRRLALYGIGYNPHAKPAKDQPQGTTTREALLAGGVSGMDIACTICGHEHRSRPSHKNNEGTWYTCPACQSNFLPPQSVVGCPVCGDTDTVPYPGHPDMRVCSGCYHKWTLTAETGPI